MPIIIACCVVVSFSIGAATGWTAYKSHARKVWLKHLAKIIDLQNKPGNNVVRLPTSKNKKG